METLNQMMGLHADKLNLLQMLVRALITFFVALVFIRISGQRTLGTQNAFDQLTLLILGAILGRGIVSASQPFFPSLGAVLLIMILHRVLAWCTYKSDRLGSIFKGRDIVLFKNGEFQRGAMAKEYITEADINEAMRLIGNIHSTDRLEEARLERAGEVSIVRKEV